MLLEYFNSLFEAIEPQELLFLCIFYHCPFPEELGQHRFNILVKSMLEYSDNINARNLHNAISQAGGFMPIQEILEGYDLFLMPYV